MNGAPSQVDTFDPKPALEQFAGQRPESTVKLTTENATGGLMPSPFRFSIFGQSGIQISELFPEVARFAEDLCVIRSMQTDVPVCKVVRRNTVRHDSCGDFFGQRDEGFRLRISGVTGL